MKTHQCQMTKPTLLGIVMAMAACGGGGPVGPSVQDVEYRLSGTGTVTEVVAVVFIGTEENRLEQCDVTLPWSFTFTPAGRAGPCASLAAFQQDMPGCLRAELWFDGNLQESDEVCATEGDPLPSGWTNPLPPHMDVEVGGLFCRFDGTDGSGVGVLSNQIHYRGSQSPYAICGPGASE